MLCHLVLVHKQLVFSVLVLAAFSTVTHASFLSLPAWVPCCSFVPDTGGERCSGSAQHAPSLRLSQTHHYVVCMLVCFGWLGAHGLWSCCAHASVLPCMPLECCPEQADAGSTILQVAFASCVVCLVILLSRVDAMVVHVCLVDGLTNSCPPWGADHPVLLY